MKNALFSVILFFPFYVLAEDLPLTVQQFNNLKLSDSRSRANEYFEKEYLVEGFGRYGYECPPCPDGAMCEPCPPTEFILYDMHIPSAEFRVPYRQNTPGGPEPKKWDNGTKVRIRVKVIQQFTVEAVKTAEDNRRDEIEVAKNKRWGQMLKKSLDDNLVNSSCPPSMKAAGGDIVNCYSLPNGKNGK